MLEKGHLAGDTACSVRRLPGVAPPHQFCCSSDPGPLLHPPGESCLPPAGRLHGGALAKPKLQTLGNGGAQETHELAEVWESVFTVFAASKADTLLGSLTLA